MVSLFWLVWVRVPRVWVLKIIYLNIKKLIKITFGIRFFTLLWIFKCVFNNLIWDADSCTLVNDTILGLYFRHFSSCFSCIVLTHNNTVLFIFPKSYRQRKYQPINRMHFKTGIYIWCFLFLFFSSFFFITLAFGNYHLNLSFFS